MLFGSMPKSMLNLGEAYELSMKMTAFNTMIQFEVELFLVSTVNH